MSFFNAFQLLCHCYKRRFKLLEEKEGWEDCDNVYYGNNTHCLDSRQEENCICYNTEGKNGKSMSLLKSQIH